MRWCGAAACSAGVGLAVPMSMPRKTCRESTEMISPPRWRATPTAAVVFPVAVAPRITMRLVLFMIVGDGDLIHRYNSICRK